MNINVENAIKKFFNNPSFQMIYLEAVANSLDANARNIDIKIYCDSFSDVNSLKIEIKDDGDGFTDENLAKFSELLQNSDDQHKGLGRLIYLAYFKEIEIESVFNSKKCAFTFTRKFDPETVILESAPNSRQETLLTFTSYWRDRVSNHDFLRPSYIKQLLLTKFMPNWYSLKKSNIDFCINISLVVPNNRETKDFYGYTETLNITDIPEFEEEEIECKDLDFFENKLEIAYSIKNVGGAGTLITAICIDNRVIHQKIFNQGKIPAGYDVIFLLSSSFFNGKTDDERENLKLNPYEIALIKKVFTKRASEILNQNIDGLKEINERAVESMSSKYPHLSGLFDEEYIGIIDEDESIKQAREILFKQELDLLSSDFIDDKKFEESLNVSSRKLAEYILYRTKIIKKLKSIDVSDPEGKIHDIIIQKKKKISSSTFTDDIYFNNIWLMDDKFMSYAHVLSDLEMEKLMETLNIDMELPNPTRRPDIAIISQSNIDESEQVEVVIVELKKSGLDVCRNRDVVEQLKQRARNLLVFYPNKISRIWFYGIVDFDQEMEDSLFEDGWKPLYSKDKMYYKRQPIKASNGCMCEADMFVLSHKTMWEDAEHRNSTFLKILQSEFKNSVMTDPTCDTALVPTDNTEVTEITS